MKRIVIQCLAAVMCVMLVSSCGGDSVGTKAGKELCDCLKEIEKKQSKSSGGGLEGLASGFEAFGCLMAIGEKYKEYFGGDEQNVMFKNPKDQKDFEAALLKCSPEFAKQMKDEE
jgi:hypothetical protein